MNKAGLKKVVKTVRGKKGSVTRTYWVKAKETVKGAARKVGGFVGKHKGKIAAAAALAGAAMLARKGHAAYKSHTAGMSADEKSAFHSNLRNMISSPRNAAHTVGQLARAGAGAAGRGIRNAAVSAGSGIRRGARAVAAAPGRVRDYAKGQHEDLKSARETYALGRSAGANRKESGALAALDYGIGRKMRRSKKAG